MPAGIGGNKMGALSPRLPESIHRDIRAITKAEGVSINQLISAAITEKFLLL
jgi:predicted HicB family RNase H-like nuclease